VYNNPGQYDEVKRAWAFYVLSHQAFYSIMCNSWKCYMQRNGAKQFDGKKAALTEEYAKRLEHTSLFCREALDVLRKTDRENAFHYVDPPYFQADMGHYGGYTKEDFVRLLELLSTLKGKFMLSSYPSDILSAYIKQNGWYSKEFEMSRPAGWGRKTEVLTMNYEIK
jgi:DNA adenine methylase